jgi:signal transduction histidine kinase
LCSLPMKSAFHTWWLSRISAPANVHDVLQRQQFSLLLQTLFVFAPLNALVTLGTWMIDPAPNPVHYMLLLAASVIITVAHLIARRGHYRPAVYLLLGTIISVLYKIAIESPQTGMSFWLAMTIALLLAMMLLPRRDVLVCGGLILVAILTQPVVNPALPFSHTFIPAAIYIVFFGICWVFLNFRDRLDGERQAELSAALARSEAANTALEATNAALARSNQELEQAHARAEESVQVKSQFLATVSHELRTPMNAIRGFTGIMLSGMGGTLDEDARHMIARIDTNSERLLRLINDILDLSRIEARKLEVVYTPLMLRQLVNRWEGEVGVLAAQNSLHFTTEVDPQLPESIYGDAERLSQIVINLLSNAFKFTPEGSVHLCISQQGDMYQIQVWDTGIGIAAEAQQYIFEEFRQVDGSTTRPYRGSGLGLAIVRNLVRMMDGQITLESNLGAGSTFTVTLPLLTPVNIEQKGA